MTDTRCSCGFTETAGEAITDHFLEAFAPEDGLASDGLVHEEARPDLTCSCGLVAATPSELDAHFLQAFTPGDLIGRDGRKHECNLRKDLGFLPLTRGFQIDAYHIMR